MTDGCAEQTEYTPVPPEWRLCSNSSFNLPLGPDSLRATDFMLQALSDFLCNYVCLHIRSYCIVLELEKIARLDGTFQSFRRNGDSRKRSRGRRTGGPNFSRI